MTGRNSTYTAAYRVRPKSHFLEVEESLPVRKLTKREDEALERGGSLEQGASNWSEEEIEASVRAYIEMKRKDDAGEPYTKTSYYRALSEQFPARSPKSFEYRMQNISYVYSLLGRRWLEGHKPKRNVGTNVAALIEKKIAEIEGSDIPPTAAFELEVEQARRRKMASPPEGSQTPEKTQSSTTQYIRSAEVVAWVLEAADGVCEACDQSAPFSKSDGTSYLEVHHLRRLADGGSDTIANAIAACPNCHRELHYGANRDQLLAAVYAKVSRLVEE